MLSVNPHPPTRGREKGGKGRETYKLNIKTALLITLKILIILIRQTRQNIQNQYRVSLEMGAGMLESHQQLPGSTSKSRTGLSSRRELDSGMHGSESGSGGGSSSEAGHGRRERDPCDPPALN